MQDFRFLGRWLGRMQSSGILHRVAHVRPDVSGERSASIIRVTRIGEQGTTLVVTSNRHIPLLVTANVVPTAPILVTLMMEALRSPKCRVLYEPHGVTSQNTAFFTSHSSQHLVHMSSCVTKHAQRNGDVWWEWKYISAFSYLASRPVLFIPRTLWLESCTGRRESMYYLE
jgi:hypothetical protein